MSSTLHSTAGTETRGISNDDLDLAEDLVDVLEELPMLNREDLVERANEKWPANALFDDEGRTNALELEHQPAATKLPGFGEPRDDPPCGTQIPQICKDCGDPIEVGRTCTQSMCPRCAPAWVIERAVPMVSRIWSAAKMKPGSQKLHHVAVDVHRDFFVDDDEEEPEQAVISVLQEFMKEIGMDGVVFYHPYRGADGDDPKEAEQGDWGKWKDRLFENLDWEDVRDDLSHEPHFHIIGCAEWFPGGDVTRHIYEETGFLFERIAHGGPRSVKGMEGLAKAVCYCLSHVGIDTRGDENEYVHGKKGSAYHNADDRHHDHAREVIHRVAPDVLGIPSMQIECRNDLPEEEKDDHDHDVITADGDGDSSSTDSSSTSTTTPTVPCRGQIVPADDADFVEDEDWQQQALHAEEAVETKKQWEEAGGWRGWLQEHAEDAENDPPP